MTGRDAQECPYSNPPCLCGGPTVTGQSRPPTEGPRPPSFSPSTCAPSLREAGHPAWWEVCQKCTSLGPEGRAREVTE